MIAELGSFALILAFCLSLAQAALSFAGRARLDVTLVGAGEGAAVSAFVAVSIGFGALIFAFVTSDFSVVNVAENSHTEKPLIYKIAGAWGSPRGLDPSVVLCVDRVRRRTGRGPSNLEWGLKALAVAVQGALGVLFHRLYGPGVQSLAPTCGPARGGPLAQPAPSGSGVGGPSALPLRRLRRPFCGVFPGPGRTH